MSINHTAQPLSKNVHRSAESLVDKANPKPKAQPKGAPFHWIGGKSSLMPRLIPLIPYHETYVSVFGGSGGDIYNKPRSEREIYNDANHVIVNFFRVLQDRAHREELTYRLTYMPHSRLMFAESQEVLRQCNVDPVRLAAAFYFCTYYSYAGRDPCRPEKPFICAANYARWMRTAEHLDIVARRFQRVLLENLPWQEMLDRYDRPSVCMYLDPPYLPSTRPTKNFYLFEMAEEDHVVLLDRIQQLKCKVMLSGYDSEMYREYLAKWRRAEFETYCWSSSNPEKPKRTEVLWMNYETDGSRIVTC